MVKSVYIVFCFYLLSISTIVDAAKVSIENFAEYDFRTQAFLVTKSVDIRPGDVLVIPAGAKILFAPLTGIDVKGEIYVDGKSDNQVILTSKKGAMGVGSPYDWAGITMFPGAVGSFNYSVISCASFGIRSCCDNVTLVNTTFYANGVHVQLGNKKIYINEREPVTYEPLSERKVEEITKRSVDYEDISKKKYIPLRTWVLAPVAAGLVAFGIVYLAEWDKSARAYDDYVPADRIKYRELQKDFDKLKSERALNMWLGLGLSAAGLGLGTYVTIYTIKF